MCDPLICGFYGYIKSWNTTVHIGKDWRLLDLGRALFNVTLFMKAGWYGGRELGFGFRSHELTYQLCCCLAQDLGEVA